MGLGLVMDLGESAEELREENEIEIEIYWWRAVIGSRLWKLVYWQELKQWNEMGKMRLKKNR